MDGSGLSRSGTTASVAAATIDEELNFNDFSYWRMPPPAVLPADIMMDTEGPAATAAAGVSERNGAACVNEIGSAADRFNDFSYWQMPTASLTDLGIDVPSAPSAPGSPITHAMDDDPSQAPADEPGELPSGQQEDTWMEDEDDEPPIGSLLAGDAGTRLLGLLGQLSRHLGPNSRFARAADQLQGDVWQARQIMQQQEQQEQEQEEQEEQEGREPPPEQPEGQAVHEQSGDERTTLASPQRRRLELEPAEGSTLTQPNVMESVGSLLTLLRTPRTAEIEQLGRSAPTMAATSAFGPGHPPFPPLQLFDIADAMMPLPSPASPEALATLSPPCSKFVLDEPRSCPICLEALEDAAEALEMPCSVRHVFHQTCLLTWLDSRNSCPVCRHLLPTAQPQSTPAAGEQPAPPAGETAGGAVERADTPDP